MKTVATASTWHHAVPGRGSDGTLPIFPSHCRPTSSRWSSPRNTTSPHPMPRSMTVSELLAMGTPTDRSRFRTLLRRATPDVGARTGARRHRSQLLGSRAADVLGFAGAGEAIFWAMQLFVDPATM